MNALIILLCIIVFFAVSVTVWNRVQRSRGATDKEASEPFVSIPESECCGEHETCEKDSLIVAFENQPEYFDDEELDVYAERKSGSFTDDEANEFREIFFSVIDDEKPLWIRSLQMRGINLPDQLKDEIVMIINELRSNRTHH